MAVDVESRIEIARAVDDVAAYAADPDHAPDWYANIDSATWVTEPPLRVGSQVTFVARFLGRALAYTYEVVEWTPGDRFVMRTAEGPFPMETTYAWAASGVGTLMALRNRGEPSGIARVTAPMVAAAVRRANAKDLRNLKRILERS